MTHVDDFFRQAVRDALESIPYIERPFLPEELARFKQYEEWRISKGIATQPYAVDFVLRLINNVDKLGKELQAMREYVIEQERSRGRD